jgi:uncharacterized protein (DUF58 family)
VSDPTRKAAPLAAVAREALMGRQQAERIAGTLPPLLLHAERVAATVSQGVHGRRRVGQGETFWQYRDYQPGDPTPRIDWRRSGKSDRVFVRETEWEAAQSVWFWRDASPSMCWRSHAALPTKRERAELLALSLMVLLIRAGEHVTLLGSGMAPSAGQGTLGRVAMLMARGEGEDDEGGDAGASNSLPPALSLPRHAQAIFLGDFLSPLDAIARRLETSSKAGVSAHMVQILDPAEEDLPYEGRVKFEGLEGEAGWLLSRVGDVRGAYRRRLAAHAEGLDEMARRTGCRVTRHRTDRSPETALLAIYNALSARRGP